MLFLAPRHLLLALTGPPDLRDRVPALHHLIKHTRLELVDLWRFWRFLMTTSFLRSSSWGLYLRKSFYLSDSGLGLDKKSRGRGRVVALLHTLDDVVNLIDHIPPLRFRFLIILRTLNSNLSSNLLRFRILLVYLLVLLLKISFLEIITRQLILWWGQ